MYELLKRLIERRAGLWEAIKETAALNARAGYEGSPEDEEAWARANAELNDLDKRIAEITNLLARDKAAEEARVKFGDLPAAKTDRTDDAAVLRSIAKGEMRGAEFKPMAGEMRDLTKIATDGLETVPTSFYARLVEHMIEVSAIRQTNVTVLTTASGEDLQVPKTTSHSTAAIVAEGAPITESDPQFGQVTLQAFKYGFLVQASRELVDDTGVDLIGYLASQGGRALGNASGAHFVTGTGSAQPNGAVTASTLGKTGATTVSGAFSSNDLIDLYFSVIAPYRIQGWWMLSDAGMAAARKLREDGTNGQYLWAPGLVAGEVSTLLGRPVVSDTNIADPALSAKSVLFGDLSTYFIRDVGSVRIERSDEFAFSSDLITWRFLFRTDGDLVDLTGAVKHFIGAAT